MNGSAMQYLSYKWCRKVTLGGALFAGIFFCYCVAFAASNIQLNGYPDLGTLKMGTLDDSDKDWVVINDVRLPLREGATFNLPGNLNSGSSSLKKGSRVGIIFDDNGNVESVWLIPDDLEIQ